MEPARDIDTREVLACDESFFAALLAADHDLLGDTGRRLRHHRRAERPGRTPGRTARRDQLPFAEMTRYAEERSVRLRDSAAVVTGRTQMVMRYQGNEVTAQSRYTHVYRAIAAGGA